MLLQSTGHTYIKLAQENHHVFEFQTLDQPTGRQEPLQCHVWFVAKERLYWWLQFLTVKSKNLSFSVNYLLYIIACAHKPSSLMDSTQGSTWLTHSGTYFAHCTINTAKCCRTVRRKERQAIHLGMRDVYGTYRQEWKAHVQQLHVNQINN